MPTHIVVGVDDSDGARNALRWTINYARAVDGHITVVHAYEPSIAWIDVGSKEEPQVREADHRRAVATANAIFDDVVPSEDTNIRATVLTIAGHSAQVLLEAARGADLLVVGSRGRGGFAGVLLGSVSQRCAQHSTCPVVIVPARSH